jgi:hypothetical protein
MQAAMTTKEGLTAYRRKLMLKPVADVQAVPQVPAVVAADQVVAVLADRDVVLPADQAVAAEHAGQEDDKR